MVVSSICFLSIYVGNQLFWPLRKLKHLFSPIKSHLKPPTVRFNALTVRFSLSTVRFNALTVRFSLPTVRLNALTVRFNGLRTHFKPLTVRFSLPTVRLNALTVRFNCLRTHFKLLTVCFDLQTVWSGLFYPNKNFLSLKSGFYEVFSWMNWKFKKGSTNKVLPFYNIISALILQLYRFSNSRK